jgi:hypothetical protein
MEMNSMADTESNYTKIRVFFKDCTVLYISEDEVIVYKLCGNYGYIEYLNDKDQPHRLENQPAVEHANGTKAWLVDGKRHRLDGQPAVVWANGDKSWWVDGQRHRVDGPAIDWAYGDTEWWVAGKQYTQAAFEEKYGQLH